MLKRIIQQKDNELPYICLVQKLVLILLACCLLSCQGTGQQSALISDLSLKYLIQIPKAKSQNTPVLILLHGYGSDENDLFTLRNVFPPNYLIISVRAPFQLVDKGYKWYDPIERNGHKDGKKEMLDSSYTIIVHFLNEIEKRYQVNKNNIYLIGFSQGAVMSYIVGLTSPESVRGIGVLSGMLFASVKPAVIMTNDLKKLKIFIAHGTKDQVINFEEAKTANDFLIGFGLHPNFHKYPELGHSICNPEINELVKWLK